MVIIKEMNELVRETLLSVLASSINGNCYHFALAMHRELGWRLIGVMDGEDIVHAGVVSPEEKIWDGRGEISREEFIKPFDGFGRRIVDYISESALLATGKVVGEMIEFYREKAQAVWPKLPWKSVSREKEVMEFAKELEALSRKYRLWVCAPFPAAPPVLFEGHDDEEGYEIEATADGRTYTINRKL